MFYGQKTPVTTKIKIQFNLHSMNQFYLPWVSNSVSMTDWDTDYKYTVGNLHEKIDFVVYVKTLEIRVDFFNQFRCSTVDFFM